MFRRVGIIAMMALLSLGGTPTRAVGQETEEQVEHRLVQANYARGGFYFGMEGLAAIENTEIVGGQDRYLISGGFQARMGHRHNRWTATELSGLYVHTFGGDLQFLPPIGVLSGNFLAWGMYVSQRVYFTKARFQPFVGAGLGFLQIRSNEDFGFLLDPGGGFRVVPTPNVTPGFSMVFSAGMEMYATETVAFTLQANYHLQVGHIDDTDFITAGLGMQFF
ncbi:MAG: hypothetical protein JRG92_12750 [Deltaproteobacteria bacterium]|nr:hypothetical protein [Deltaproteobacteria bacterium]MBW2384500.1 hypothetical protein [Deltaproteobacteria bacterium]MBW2696595.1 hypothetical protein [Deltaproteobacteria bacterium]